MKSTSLCLQVRFALCWQGSFKHHMVLSRSLTCLLLQSRILSSSISSLQRLTPFPQQYQLRSYAMADQGCFNCGAGDHQGEKVERILVSWLTNPKHVTVLRRQLQHGELRRISLYNCTNVWFLSYNCGRMSDHLLENMPNSEQNQVIWAEIAVKHKSQSHATNVCHLLGNEPGFWQNRWSRRSYRQRLYFTRCSSRFRSSTKKQLSRW